MPQDMAHEQHEWLLERIGWVVIMLVLLGALLGLFGSGPVAAAQAGSTDAPLWIEYSRFERKLSPAAVNLHVNPAALQDGMLRLRVDAAYARAMNIVGFTPEPASQEFAGDTIVYVFQAAALRGEGQILLRLNPDTTGPVQARIGLEGALPFVFNQFVWP